MSHTPGPWKWDEGQGVITAEWNGFPWHIATVDMSELGWHEDDLCKSRENGANARLIAAAPDLLEALEYINDNLDLYHGASEKVQADGYALMKSAIAKARGQ